MWLRLTQKRHQPVRGKDLNVIQNQSLEAVLQTSVSYVTNINIKKIKIHFEFVK